MYYRKCDKKWFCVSCLRKFLRKKVKEYLRTRGDLTPQERILVALAGGTKSLVNLELICKVERTYPSVKISALIIKEPVIFPPEIELVKVLRKVASELGVEVVGEVSIDCSKGDSWEARLITCLNIAKSMDFTSVALGITLDDQVTRLMYKLIRGEVSLFPRKVRGVKVLTPLESIFLKEVLIYATSVGFPLFSSGYSENETKNLIVDFVYELEDKDPNVKFVLRNSLIEVMRSLGGRGASPEVDPHSRWLVR